MPIAFMIQNFKSQLEYEEEIESRRLMEGCRSQTVQNPDNTDVMLNSILKKGKKITNRFTSRPLSSVKTKKQGRVRKKRNSAHIFTDRGENSGK